MGLLIDETFFVRDINLVNLTEPKVLERILSFIAKYEPLCLKGVLGTSLYKIVDTETSQRVDDIIEGVEWIGATGIDRVWDGLVHDDISLIANYIYVYFQRANALQTTGVATKASKPEAGINASPRDKQINAWQYFATESRHLISFLWNQRDVDGNRIYPEFTWQQYSESMAFTRVGGINYFDL